MNRSISLSEHHARRRKTQERRERDDGSSSRSRSDQLGVAHDAACFGAHEATARRGKTSRGARGVDAEHASYAAEACIGYEAERSRTKRGVVSPARSSFSSPDLDIEDVSRYDTNCNRSQGSSRYSQSRGSSARGAYSTSSYSQNSRSGAGASRASSYPSASDDSFVSVDMGYESASRFDGSTIATNSVLEEGGTAPRLSRSKDEDDIRDGIVDISTFIATWLAGALSFVIGIFLALLSPVVRLIKLIFGDLTGLIGDAFGLALRNNPSLSQDLEGLTRMLKNFSSRPERWRRSNSRESNHPPRQEQTHDGHSYNDDCEASLGSGYTHSTYYSHATDEGTHDGPQYVGGWSPSIASSRGSNSRGSYPSTGSYGSARPNRSRSSKSYSSLPQVQEDDVSSCPSYSYYPDDVSVGTSASTDSRRLTQRVSGGRSLLKGSRRGSSH